MIAREVPKNDAKTSLASPSIQVLHLAILSLKSKGCCIYLSCSCEHRSGGLCRYGRLRYLVHALLIERGARAPLIGEDGVSFVL